MIPNSNISKLKEEGGFLREKAENYVKNHPEILENFQVYKKKLREELKKLNTTNTMNVLIVEDNGIEAELMGEYVRELGYSVGGIVDSGEQALRLIQNKNIGLAILDIQLNGELNGIQTAKKIYEIEPMPFIYLTRVEDARRIDLAIESYPGAFVSKPFVKKDLDIALRIARRNFVRPKPEVEEEKEHFFFRTKDRNIRVLIADILYLKAQGAWTDIYIGKKHTVAMRLNECLRRLPQKTFCRIHRSYAVNLDKVDAFDRNHVFIGGAEIPVGGNYKDDFLKTIEAL